ncbi:serine hydrolase domain-containing protein [Streptomyces sp. NPDC002276]
MDVQDRTAAGFEKVADVFAAYRNGGPVVDLWAGVTDPATERPWRADTPQLVFSGAKGLTTACVLPVERGLLSLDAPAARYWPEFAAAGKERITVAEIFSDQARLPGVQQPVATEELLDPEHMAGLLAAYWLPTRPPCGTPPPSAGLNSLPWEPM